MSRDDTRKRASKKIQDLPKGGYTPAFRDYEMHKGGIRRKVPKVRKERPVTAPKAEPKLSRSQRRKLKKKQ